MLRKALFCTAVAVGTVLVSAPSAHADPEICVTVTVTAPVTRSAGDCVPFVMESDDCMTGGQSWMPFLAFQAQYCGPLTVFLPSDS